MTVGELIKELQKHDPNKIVLVTAYEEGFDKLTKVCEVSVAYEPSDRYWSGDYNDDPYNKFTIEAILLPRK
jgi:hypothetical protein